MTPSGRLLVALIALTLLGLGQARTDPEGAPVVLRGLSVEVHDPNGGVPAGTESRAMTILEDGEQREISTIEALSARDRSWGIVIWVDETAAARSQIEAAVAALQAHSRQLTELGKVSLVVAEDIPRIWLQPSERPQEVSAALQEVASTNFRVAGARSSDHLEWRRQQLIAELADLRRVGELRALILIGDPGNAGDPGELGRSAASGLRDLSLGATLAAMNWVVFPFADPAAEADGLATLAAETGGALLRTPEEVGSALVRLRERYWVEYLGSGSLSARPRRLELGSQRQGWIVRGARWRSGSLPETVSLARAERFLRRGDEGDLPIESAVELLSDDNGRLEVRVEVLTDLGALPQATDRRSSSLRVSLLLEGFDGPPTVFHQRGRGSDLSQARRWFLEATLVAPEDLQELIVVVEDHESGIWGVAAANTDADSLGILGAETVAETVDLRPARVERAAVVQPEAAAETKLIRLLPLGNRQATGSQQFHTISLNSLVRKARFFLDGRQVAEDGRPPFSARIDLGSAVRPHELMVVAYDRADRELGRDTLLVNRRLTSFAVAILRADRSGSAPELEVAAAVSLPPGASLERVDFYWNDSLQTSLVEEPFETRLTAVSTSAGVDFLRVSAVLTDGRSVEDVRLFSVAGPVEEVEVNLVEIFSVVTDEAGEPVRGLRKSDFEVRLRGRPVSLQRFGVAEDVPLALGLVIDTSLSMDAIMPETKTAALRFLTDLVSPGDRAFVVDFDTRPRLATGMTGDLKRLFRALSSLSAGGATALYDAIVFSTLHFEGGQDRRAVVLLTDGDDYRSRFSVGKAIRQARAAAVPIYIISLAGLDWLRPTIRRVDLENVAKRTGGRVFYVRSRQELSPAYAKIEAELRSQYVLAFSSPEALSDKELDGLEVRVRRPRLEVRAVVAGRSVQ